MYKTKAIIIARGELGEAGRILDVLTQDFGRLLVTARGVRKSTSKLNPHIQLFNESEIMFVDGKKNKVLTSALKLSSFERLKKDLVKFQEASYAAKLVRQITFSGGEQENRLYHLFREFLVALERSKSDNICLISRYFEFGLLGNLGLRPHFERCLGCGENNSPWRVDMAQGGRVCKTCVSEAGNQIINISTDAQVLLEDLAKYRQPTRLVNKETVKEIANVFSQYFSYYMEKVPLNIV